MIIEEKDLSWDVSRRVDAVVVGSGAGGAVIAYELAAAGFSVVIVEAGGYYKTEDFNCNSVQMADLLYYDRGFTATLGEPGIMLPWGRCVGGTTTINSGTCFRTPEKILKQWQFEFGLKRFSNDDLVPHFEAIEKVLGVSPVPEKLLGKSAEIFRRGAETLGYKGKPLLRNAPNCQGTGVCAFGCPTGAKRSMDKSYIPMAMDTGADLYADCLVTKVKTSNHKAIGVEGVFRDRTTGRPTYHLEIFAKVVVLACGAIHTPYLLKKTGFFRKNKALGRNLRIHPAARLLAVMDEEVRGWEGVPQSFMVDQFADEGIMFEGAFAPPQLYAAAGFHSPEENLNLMKKYPYIATFGVFISDTSKGRVLYLKDGRPLVIYKLNQQDVNKFIRGIAIGCKIFLAGGAKEVYPPIFGAGILKSMRDAERLFDMKAKAGDLELIAFHPMGTCRMGTDPLNSVVNSNCETHQLSRCFITDASVIPSTPGVNPQMTIMAISRKTAYFLIENKKEYFS